jgi:selenide,water dikinase
MERLNRRAAEKMTAQGRGVHACTDITGFGLAVHASEMAGEKYTLLIDSSSLPLLGGAPDYAKQDYITSGGGRNRKFMAGKADVSSLPPAMQEIIFDPQTSGGLLIAADSETAEKLCLAIRRDDPAAAIIGKVEPRKEKAVIFV